MKAGRELDSLIAEKVMGYAAFTPQILPLLKSHLVFGERRGDVCVACGRNDDTKECLPHYSTDISAAWCVVEKMLEMGRGFEMKMSELIPGRYWVAFQGSPHANPWTSESAAHAICEAALVVAEEIEKAKKNG